MQSYLSGRGGEPQIEGNSNEGFRSYLDSSQNPDPNDAPQALPVEVAADLENEVIYEEEGCPKVEVSSIDVNPFRLPFTCLTDPFETRLRVLISLFSRFLPDL